jgi:multidrug efflux pump subunit AcrB
VTILSGLPSAGFGVLLTLLLFGEELNIYSPPALQFVLTLARSPDFS